MAALKAGPWAQLVGFLAVVAAAVGVGTYLLMPERELPVYQPGDVNPAVVDPAVAHVQNHRILPFSLLNQLGDTVELADVDGQILVSAFFFTRCPTICPVMTSQMQRVAAQYADEPRLRLLSHSVTPEADSVPVLAAYAARYGADPNRWWFLTGPKRDIYTLARRSYFACLSEGDGGLQDFVHTENLVLVDARGRLRGFYDGTSQVEVDQLIADIELLLDALPSAP